MSDSWTDLLLLSLTRDGQAGVADEDVDGAGGAHCLAHRCLDLQPSA